MDVCKERAMIEGQVKAEHNFGSSWNVFRGIIRQEGILGLYRAYWLHQFTWAPFNGIYWMVYEQCKEKCRRRLGKADGVSTFLISSFSAGIVASYALSPVDLVKTRLQVQRSNPELFDF